MQKPMPYLDNPPAVIPIDVGRQLFVDNFLIDSTILTRTYYTTPKGVEELMMTYLCVKDCQLRLAGNKIINLTAGKHSSQPDPDEADVIEVAKPLKAVHMGGKLSRGSGYNPPRFRSLLAGESDLAARAQRLQLDPSEYA